MRHDFFADLSVLVRLCHSGPLFCLRQGRFGNDVLFDSVVHLDTHIKLALFCFQTITFFLLNGIQQVLDDQHL